MVKKTMITPRRGGPSDTLELMRPAMLLVGCGMCYVAVLQAQSAPPATRVAPVTETVHGVRITDPYRWLEDQNSPETRAWVEAQMNFTQAALKKVAVRGRIHQRLEQLMKVDLMTPPTIRPGRYFFSRRNAAESQFVVYVRENGVDRVLIDPNPLSPDHTTSASLLDVSAAGTLAAYGLREGGADETTLAFRDVRSGQDLKDRFPAARYYGVALAPDLQGVYYTKMLDEGPRLYFHAMGSDIAQDRVVFGEQFGPSQLGSCSISDNGRWLFCHVYTGSSGDKVDIYVQDLESAGPMRPVAVNLDAGFSADVAGDQMYMMTNWKAPNWRVVRVDLERPGVDHWKEIVAERKSVMESFSAVGGHLAVTWLEDVHSHVEIFDAEGKSVRELKLPELGVSSGPYGRWDTDEAFFAFESIGRAETIYRYSVSSGEQSVWFQTQVPFDQNTIEVKQVWFPSKDGTRIPMFVAHKKGLRLDGSHPLILTGYGGFNVSEKPEASSTALAWLDMGGVYAIANLRGGGEFGEHWHRAGMLEKKQNVFDDFIAAAEYLIREKYTRKQKLAIWGGSNGGLLVGAALTQRPDLFQAVICGAPLLDMVRYDKFKVAKFWVPEYGTAYDAEQFKVLYRYSPYHRVEKGAKYPAVMLVTGDADTRVDPLHARKMAALLQASTGSAQPILLHYNTKAGHSAGLPVAQVIDTTADELAFLAWQLGVR